MNLLSKILSGIGILVLILLLLYIIYIVVVVVLVASVSKQVEDSVKESNTSNNTNSEYKSTPEVEIFPVPSYLLNFTTNSVLLENEYIQIGDYFLVLSDIYLMVYKKSEFLDFKPKNIIFHAVNTIYPTPKVAKLVLEPDNNLAVYGKDSQMLWNTGTSNKGVLPTLTSPSQLKIVDGSIQIIDGSGAVIWDAGAFKLYPPAKNSFMWFSK